MKDVIFITPNNSNGIYQGLSARYSAIETPTWSLLLAESCRSKNFDVEILDTLAENLNDDQAFERISKSNPKLICFVIYGQNVNAGTTNMSGAVRLAEYIKRKKINKKIAFIGSHIQALPLETMEKEQCIDIAFLNEGVYALHNLLKLQHFSDDSLFDVKGIAFRTNTDKIIFNQAEVVVPAERMDQDLPGYAWDLLPFKNKPFDLYRSPMWHAEYIEENRSPYAAIQTSLGCQFKCNFCMINIINKNDNNEIGIASHYNKMRFWSTDLILKEFKKLISLGVKTIKITDEMFLLNKKYYFSLCKELSKLNKNDELKMWAYSRIDTVKNPEALEVVRSAGIKWLCLGIESADKKVRLEVSKGKFEDVDVEKVVEQIHAADINVMANYIYGLPGDNLESIEKTFQLSVKLNTLGWNTYAAMALPGSQLYYDAKLKKVDLPKNYEQYSFHAFDTLPLPTENLSAGEVLKLRDQKFNEYHKNPKFLEKINKKFGSKAVNNINDMLKIKLKRKIYN